MGEVKAKQILVKWRSRNSPDSPNPHSPLNTRVLERVLQTSVEVRHEFGDRPLVGHIARHALGDLDRVRLGEVPRGGGIVDTERGGLGALDAARGVLHRLDGSHAAVDLDALALVVEVLSRRLSGSSEETAHHHSRSTEGDGLGNVPDVADTSVSDGGDAEPGAGRQRGTNSMRRPREKRDRGQEI